MSVLSTLSFSPRAATLCLAGLTLGCLFATLLAAFTLSGQAGVNRLIEKYPKSRGLLTIWSGRWNLLRHALMAVMTLTQLITVVCALSIPTGEGLAAQAALAAVLALTALLWLVAFHLLPGVLSQAFADRFSVSFLGLVSLVARILYPLIWPTVHIEQFFLRVFTASSAQQDRPTTEDEIRSVVERATADDLEDEEKQIIESVFEFGDTITREIMTPRVDMEGLELGDTITQAIEQIKDSSHSRFPVYQATTDDIRGLAHIRDLLREIHEGHGERTLEEMIKELPFVPESMPINDLLTLMRSEKSHMAVVVDEYGGTAGLVTMEDILEELVGDILDEHDTDEYLVQRLSDGSAVLDARLPVEEAGELLGIAIPESDEYDSLGGYVFHALGRIPRPGETVEDADFHMTVQTANARQIQTLRVRRVEPADASSG